MHYGKEARLKNLFLKYQLVKGLEANDIYLAIKFITNNLSLFLIKQKSIKIDTVL